ncbi:MULTISPECIES: DUF5999 family protein [Streptomyces]|uniref:DUF5999 family protein n=1 Tax=Streptomyces TaxID=1883 RepID=UPI000FD66CB5|nr:DUF5999 family protein [Streptomyces sp. B29(2018)]
MCQHVPPCPTADSADNQAARAVVVRYEQGWSRLCNGVVLLDDTGVILPDGQTQEPHRAGRTAA